MGKKGKGYKREEEQEPVKKRNVITEEQLMDKSHMDRTQFIPMLSSQSMYEPFTFDKFNEAALKKIVTDLNHLLYIDFKTFWATILYNPSLKICLSTCLAYLHRRWMNAYRYSKQESNVFDQSQQNLMNFKRVKDQATYQFTEGITQVLLFIYHRIVSFNLENMELSQLYKISEEISRKYILDFPKLFEIAQIYGNTNPEIVRYIIKMYNQTLPTFYQTLTTTILPYLFQKLEDVVRNAKRQTQKQQYGINYSYKRLAGQQTSQGEQELRRKITILMQMIGFSDTIKLIIKHFPQDCVNHCYFNSRIQFIYQNIFLELQVAYKVWNYQGQDITMLNMINYILKQCLNYFVDYFNRCNDIIVLKYKKSSTREAYINSLQRVFKQFGRRHNVGKKNQVKNLLMYKIIQKEVDILKIAQNIYAQEEQNRNQEFNLQYLKDFIIALENQIKKDQYINQQDQQRQQEIEEETQAEPVDQDQIDQVVPDSSVIAARKPSQQNQNMQLQTPDADITQLEMMIPRRNRSEDYYSKLYADFNNKYYKGEYEDDYDDIADIDKRPLFYDQQSSDTESEGEQQKRLVSNINNLQHVKQIHDNHKINRQNLRLQNSQKPKYTKVQTNSNNYHNNNNNNNKFYQNSSENRSNDKQYQQKEGKPKLKYVSKQKQQQVQETDNINKKRQFNDIIQLQQLQKTQQDEKKGGQGFKKSNKSHNYKPKDKHQNHDKGQNKNKQTYDKAFGKKYREK